MKKIIIIIFIVTIWVGMEYTQSIENHEGFKVQQVLVQHIGEVTETRMNIIADTNNYNEEKMFSRIKQYYDFVYGEADKLTIILFNSEDDFRNYNVYAEETFYKQSNGNVFVK